MGKTVNSCAGQLRALLAMAAIVVALGSSLRGQGSTLPFEPVKDRGQSITGAYEGWYTNPDGSYSLLVGYFNRNRTQTLDIPIGPNNRIEPGGPDMGQPTHFEARRQWGTFVVKVPKDFGAKKLTWTIVANGVTNVIPLNINELWIVEPLKDAGVGNTPPVVRFSEDGPTFTGPPETVANYYEARVGTPLTLNAWVTDDGVKPPERAAREGPNASIRWGKFRGPGDAKFAEASPKVDEKAGGKAATTVTFSEPGEYVLRVVATDASGEGGGGFQCCWTTTHVKVTVAKP
jgi:hypothetical protein